MKRVLSLLLFTSSIFSMELDLVKSTPIKQVFVPSKLGSLELYHGKKGFFVRKDEQKHAIKKYFTDPIVRDITKKQLTAFLEAGYLSLNQMEDGEFSLKANGRINGGGPILGAAAYWVTKSLCYAIGFAAIAGAVVTGGKVGSNKSNRQTARMVANGLGATSGILLGNMAVSTTATTIIYTTSGVVLGTAGAGAGIAGASGIAGAVVGGTAAAKTAGLVTAAAVTSTGSVAGTIAGIESVSVAVGTFFGMLPTP